MKFQEDNFSSFKDAVLPLLESHWQEVEWGQDNIPLNPNLALYEELFLSSQVRFFTTRDDEGDTLGYASFFIQDHPHHKGSQFASNDMLYVLPCHRHTGYTQCFIDYCETALKYSGVQVITYSMKQNHKFENLMTSSGYEHTECVYSKFVG